MKDSTPGYANELREAFKLDEGKPRMDLLEWDVLLEAAKILTIGASKYNDRNWQGLDPHRLEASMLRHVAARSMGELIDPEDGILHSSHFLVNAMFLTWFDLHPREAKDDADI